MAAPLVSVVVSTHNRPQRLARLLNALRAQTLASDDFEVVVVDNGSGPETGRALAREQARGGLDAAHPPYPDRGRPRSGTQPRLASVDRPAGRVHRRRLRAHPGLADGAARRRRAGAGGGPAGPDPSCARRAAPRRAALAHRAHRGVSDRSTKPATSPIPDAVLEALAGFDERFGLEPAGEDTDLAWRAIGAGCRTVFAADAVVHHAVEPIGVIGMLRRAARWSAVVRVFSDHPETRTMLYRGRFWNVWHYLAYRSLLSMAGPRWLRRLLIMRHLLALRRRARQAGGGRGAVAFLLVHDVVECWAVARGAIRHRTLVL